MLDDNFYGVPQAVAVPLDRPDRLESVNATLAEMRSTGFLAASVARSGIEGLRLRQRPASNRDRRDPRSLGFGLDFKLRHFLSAVPLGGLYRRVHRSLVQRGPNAHHAPRQGTHGASGAATVVQSVPTPLGDATKTLI